MDIDLNPVLTPVRDLGEFIREQRQAAQISVRALAAKAGVSNPYLSQVERGLRRPSAEILAQIAHGLSISVETMLAKAGILDAPEAPEVIAAVRADPVLTERQKSVLIDIYAALRKEAQAAQEASAPEPATGTIPAIAPSPEATRTTEATTATAAPDGSVPMDHPEAADEPRTITVEPTTNPGITSMPEGENHADQ